VYRAAQAQVEDLDERRTDRGQYGLHPHDGADALLDQVVAVLVSTSRWSRAGSRGAITGRSSRVRSVRAITRASAASDLCSPLNAGDVGEYVPVGIQDIDLAGVQQGDE
jgi:hypothetical protein